MEHSTLDQAVALLARAQRGVLLTVLPEPSADAFASATALLLALGSTGKTAALVSPSHVPESLQFLPGTSQVQEAIPSPPELLIDVPLGGRRPESVRWEVVGDALRITVHPDRGGQPFPEGDVRVQRGAYPWDVIVTVGVPRLPLLGEVFASHARFFYETPILNVDRGTANEFFGTVNLVPATAATVAEVIADLLETLGGVNLLSPDVATSLLTGILAGTDSLRAPTTTPRTFAIASRLLLQEADHATVVRNLFQSHALADLRLFGRVLTRIEELEVASGSTLSAPLLSTLTEQDFSAVGTTPDAVPRLLSEAVAWVGEHRVVILAFERQRGRLEALIALGRVSTDDRAAFAEGTHGARVGPWVLVNLGSIAPADASHYITKELLPRLPGRGT